MAARSVPIIPAVIVTRIVRAIASIVVMPVIVRLIVIISAVVARIIITGPVKTRYSYRHVKMNSCLRGLWSKSD
jgi:hypothetical protein